jgi:hypothetical protein
MSAARWRSGGRRIGNTAEAVVQVAAEAAGAHLVLERAVARGDDARVHGTRAVGPDGLHLVVLEDAEEARLHRRRGLGDLVEEDRAAPGLDEEPGAVAARAGERAAQVAEELALEERLRDCGAVLDEERRVALGAPLVDRARDDLLARARLALDEHRHAAPRRPQRQVEDRPHARRGGDEGLPALRLGGRRPGAVAVESGEHGAADRRPHEHGQALEPVGVARQVLGGAELQGGDRQLLGAGRGDGDERQLAACGTQRPHDRRALRVGQDEVGDDAADAGVAERVQRGAEATHRAHADLRLRAEQRAPHLDLQLRVSLHQQQMQISDRALRHPHLPGRGSMRGRAWPVNVGTWSSERVRWLMDAWTQRVPRLFPEAFAVGPLRLLADKPVGATPDRVITRADELELLVDEVRAAGRMALDTEFVWERTYRPKLGVVQIFTDTGPAVIDAVALPDLSPLFPVLQAPDVPVVLHGGGQDLEIFATLMGTPVRGVVDTQLVAAFLGYGLQVGLAALLERVLKVRIRRTSRTRTGPAARSAPSRWRTRARTSSTCSRSTTSSRRSWRSGAGRRG